MQGKFDTNVVLKIKKEENKAPQFCGADKTVVFNIMSTCGMPICAVCDFEKVKPHLLECRAKSRLPLNAKSVIMAIFPYKVEEKAPKNISRYAAVPDYHKVCGDMLKAASEEMKKHYVNHNFEVFIDSSPIPEVAAAVECGLGVKGKNGLLINQKYGSYVFIGEIVTDLYLPPDSPNSPKNCLDCGQCISFCNTITSKKDCLSAVNQRKKLENALEIEKIAQSRCVWGCDGCSDVCPMNKNSAATYIEEFIQGYRNEYVPGEDSSNRAYTWRGEDVIKRNYEIITAQLK